MNFNLRFEICKINPKTKLRNIYNLIFYQFKYSICFFILHYLYNSQLNIKTIGCVIISFFIFVINTLIK